jgi:hypothetical protein
VEHCAHGIVHLTLGALTLGLFPEQLASIADTLAAAAHALESGAPRSIRVC